MNRTTRNGLTYVNYCTSTYTIDGADEIVQDLKSNPAYIDAFHEGGYIWVATDRENPTAPGREAHRQTRVSPVTIGGLSCYVTREGEYFYAKHAATHLIIGAGKTQNGATCEGRRYIDKHGLASIKRDIEYRIKMRWEPPTDLHFLHGQTADQIADLYRQWLQTAYLRGGATLTPVKQGAVTHYTLFLPNCNPPHYDGLRLTPGGRKYAQCRIDGATDEHPERRNA